VSLEYCDLGPGVILPDDTHLVASILVANSVQNEEFLEEDGGKLYSSETTNCAISYQRRAGSYMRLDVRNT
jgi:hypothetical protein